MYGTRGVDLRPSKGKLQNIHCIKVIIGDSSPCHNHGDNFWAAGAVRWSLGRRNLIVIF